jgi:hypothetical protein
MHPLSLLSNSFIYVFHLVKIYLLFSHFQILHLLLIFSQILHPQWVPTFIVPHSRLFSTLLIGHFEYSFLAYVILFLNCVFPTKLYISQGQETLCLIAIVLSAKCLYLMMFLHNYYSLYSQEQLVVRIVIVRLIRPEISQAWRHMSVIPAETRWSRIHSYTELHSETLQEKKG